MFSQFSSYKSQSIRAIGLLLLVAVFAFFGGMGCSIFRSGDRASFPSLLEKTPADEANALYQDAWHSIYQDYVDPSFNKQDWYQWKDRYKGLLEDTEDAHVAIATMLSSLNDPYTRFLPPRDMSEQSISIDSKLYGVGIQIFVKDNKLVVVTPLDETPAQRAGIQPKDEIYEIDGKPTAGMSVEDAADLIRGKEGTLVKLSIRREDKTFTVTLPRAEIKIKSVFTKDLDDQSIGYIRLNSFIGESVPREMKDAILKMNKKRAFILDLRGNYGGLLSNAVEMADMFLDRGEIVSIVDRNKEKRTYSAHQGQALRTPMVVLIDGGSASASEILSGALKDHSRATLIGTKTFGKGLVQKINPLADGSGLNITISKYLTPKGTDINKKGIQPDIEIPYTNGDLLSDKDPQLDRAIEYLRTHGLAQHASQ